KKCVNYKCDTRNNSEPAIKNNHENHNSYKPYDSCDKTFMKRLESKSRTDYMLLHYNKRHGKRSCIKLCSYSFCAILRKISGNYGVSCDNCLIYVWRFYNYVIQNYHHRFSDISFCDFTEFFSSFGVELKLNLRLSGTLIKNYCCGFKVRS